MSRPQFQEFPTIWNWAKSRSNKRAWQSKYPNADEDGLNRFYEGCYNDYIKNEASYGQKRRCILECYYILKQRPFYNVWPSLEDPLCSLDLSKIPYSSILPILEPIVAVRLVNNPERGFQSFLATPQHREKDDVAGGFEILADNGTRKDGFAGMISIGVDLRSGHEDIEHWIRTNADKANANIYRKLLSMYVTISFLVNQNDFDLVTRSVLAKDRDAYRVKCDPSIVSRAEKKGVRGWDIGAKSETIPHLRRGHPAIRWCGKGKKEVRIVWINPTIVKRHRMSEIPHGHLGTDND